MALAEAMPGGTVYFWQGWDTATDTWPWIVALVLGCLVGVLVKAERLAGHVIPTMGYGVLWALAAVIGAGLAWQVWRPLAHQYRVLDERLSERMPLKLLPIRDLVPGVVLAGALGYVFSPVASLTLVGALALIGLIKRPFNNHHTPWTVRHPRWTTGGMVLAVLVVIALYAGLLLLDRQYLVTRNQGLQQWTERLCSRMPRTAPECQAPATEAQWYGQEAKR